MNALAIVFVLVNVTVSAVTCWYALCGLNACTRSTPVAVRLSFAAIAVGAFAVGLYPPELNLTDAAHVLVLTGISVGFIANRRQCVCLNCPARGKERRPAPFKNTGGGHPA